VKLIFACCLVCLPLKNLHLTSPYGYRVHPVTGKYAFHAGVDLRAKEDTVFAIMDGSVAATGYNDFLGMFIRLDHGGGFNPVTATSARFLSRRAIRSDQGNRLQFQGPQEGLPAATSTSASAISADTSTR
jgi:hypothetical protein